MLAEPKKKKKTGKPHSEDMKIDNKASNGKLALGSPFLYFSTSKAYSHDVLGNI